MSTAQHPRKLGKYEILSVLGKGGMGIVYKARDIVIDRVVAIKTIITGADGIDHNQVARLLQEARSAGRLHHPNIVTVFDYGEENGISYIVLEYAEGVDLGQVIAARQPLPLPAKIDLLQQICHGLGFAHDAGVVHRDLKPANVRLTPQGVAKIVDFGLARFDDTHLTKTGFISGTIAYMSPERMSGEAGKSDDIFALGAVAYELLTYQRAFTGASAPEVMFKIMTHTPPPPSSIAELPPQLDAIIIKCLDRDPQNRFATAYDFGAAVEEAFNAPEVRDFVKSAERSEAFRAGVEAWTGKGRRRATSAGVIEALSSSGSRVHTSDVPTASEAVPATQVLGANEASATQVLSSAGTVPQTVSSATPSQAAMTMVDASPPTMAMRTPTTPEPTLISSPTEIVAAPSSKRRSPAIAIAAGAVIAIAAAILILVVVRSPEPQQGPKQEARVAPTATEAPVAPQTTVVSTATGPTETDRLRATSELQLLSARLNAKLDTARNTGIILAPAYSEDLLTRLTDLQTVADNGDVAAVKKEGERLLADADRAIRQQRRAPPVQVAAAKPAAMTARPPAAARPQVAAVTPPPSAAQQPAPSERPAERPAAQPAPPAANPRAEISSFIRRVASAYQSRDVGFFRDHHGRFSDTMANAIRNSPSVRVELTIESIEMIDGDHARVVVQRSDEFGGGAPPAKQRRAYVLERDGGSWKITRDERP